MIAEIVGSKSLEAAWILGFMHVESLKSDKNCDLIVIAPSETRDLL